MSGPVRVVFHYHPPACPTQGWRNRRTSPLSCPLALPRAGVTEELETSPLLPPTAGGGRKVPSPTLAYAKRVHRRGFLSWHVGNHPDPQFGMLWWFLVADMPPKRVGVRTHQGHGGRYASQPGWCENASWGPRGGAWSLAFTPSGEGAKRPLPPPP